MTPLPCRVPFVNDEISAAVIGRHADEGGREARVSHDPQHVFEAARPIAYLLNQVNSCLVPARQIEKDIRNEDGLTLLSLDRTGRFLTLGNKALEVGSLPRGTEVSSDRRNVHDPSVITAQHHRYHRAAGQKWRDEIDLDNSAP